MKGEGKGRTAEVGRERKDSYSEEGKESTDRKYRESLGQL